MMKRTLTLLFALAVTAQLFAQTEVVVWHAYRGGEKTAFEKVVANYNASQNKVKVSTLAVPYDAFADKITAAVPRGKGPDVFIYAQDRLGGWIEAGKTIEPIDFYLDKATTDRYLPSTMPFTRAVSPRPDFVDSRMFSGRMPTCNFEPFLFAVTARRLCGTGIENLPASSLVPPSASVASKKFIGGVPMNCATNTVTGLS